MSKKVIVIFSFGWVALAANYLARLRMIASANNINKQDFYGWVFFLGACVSALSFSVATYMIFTQRFAANYWARPIGLLAAIPVGICIMFAAVYWPWFLTKY